MQNRLDELAGNIAMETFSSPATARRTSWPEQESGARHCWTERFAEKRRGRENPPPQDADGVIGKPRDASDGDPITPKFAISTAGLVDLRGDQIIEGVAIVGDPGTGRSSLLAGVVELDRVRYPPVVLVQRADKPLVAAALPNSDLMDLEEAIQLGCGAIVRSDDPDVRLMAIAAAADASANLRRDVCIAIDDADDLMANLANLMIYRPLTAHMAIAWSPRDTQVDAFVWAGLPSRAITAISDPDVDRFFRNGVEPDLFARLGLPRSM